MKQIYTVISVVIFILTISILGLGPDIIKLWINIFINSTTLNSMFESTGMAWIASIAWIISLIILYFIFYFTFRFPILENYQPLETEDIYKNDLLVIGISRNQHELNDSQSKYIIEFINNNENIDLEKFYSDILTERKEEEPDYIYFQLQIPIILVKNFLSNNHNKFIVLTCSKESLSIAEKFKKIIVTCWTGINEKNIEIKVLDNITNPVFLNMELSNIIKKYIEKKRIKANKILIDTTTLTKPYSIIAYNLSNNLNCNNIYVDTNKNTNTNTNTNTNKVIMHYWKIKTLRNYFTN